MQIDAIAQRAHTAWKNYRHSDLKLRRKFLEAIATEIENLSDQLIETAVREAHLPEGRFRGERGRTCGQLRAFGQHVTDGRWLNASIDRAQPDRQPFPKADIRKMNHALGPVLVFGASNFPLAFSTAGGDTASALAAGCPVIYKMHPAHPETSRLVAGAIERAMHDCGLDPGVFQHVEIDDFALVKALVQNPLIKGVGFTGSVAGGNALRKYAEERPDPIPVFTEMGSVNPVCLLHETPGEAVTAKAKMLAASVMLGVGQFCTNPGLILGIRGAALDSFCETLSAEIKASAANTMLHPGIGGNYVDKLRHALAQKGVRLLASVAEAPAAGAPAVAYVSSAVFRDNPDLHEEVFGPFSLVVECTDKADLLATCEKLSGQLTASVLCDPNALAGHRDVLDLLSAKSGRVIINMAPTGVEVCHSMVHGGPYPATSDPRFTSVGQDAILRWLRPICYQGFPETELPPALRDANPLGIPRLIDGELILAE
ncbi:aldehyde dehydrogenase family protein [Lewinella sp. W8]|nr:aldehyde dehydrogenase family protein [Lewinella sp. W8]